MHIYQIQVISSLLKQFSLLYVSIHQMSLGITSGVGFTEQLWDAKILTPVVTGHRKLKVYILDAS